VTLRVTAGGVSVTVQGDAVQEAEDALGRLAADGVPAALMAKNASLWGPGAAEEAARRLGWVDLPETSRRLLPRLAELTARFAGLDHVVLAGMDGSSLAAEVITRTHGAELTVLDTVDPHQVRRAVADRLDRTVFVVSGKSCGTIETDSNRRIFERAFREAGIDPAERIVVVTDPGSPLETSAAEAGYAVISADPDVAGCYGALTAFGLVPSALCGVDVRRLLDEASALAPALGLPYGNPGLVLGAALGTAAARGRDKLLVTDNNSGLAGFADWAEQLIAESTGKDGNGILPVVLEGMTTPGFGFADDVRRLVFGERAEDVGLAVSGPLGAQILLWEYATAVACRIIGVNPFDRPCVQESADDAAVLLRGSEEGGAPTVIAGEPALVDGHVEVHGDEDMLTGAKNLPGALEAVISAVPGGGYLAATAYLDRIGDAAAAGLRPLLAQRVADARNAPVTFGWGPRVLHSTGQFHKGGPQVGAFLQITGRVTGDLDVPGRPYGLAALQLAQAFGDLRALRSRGRPIVRLHLRDRAAGLAQLETALGG
jgi:glucose-6-phosphate isomerase